MTAAYKAEVADRGGEVQLDSATLAHIDKAASWLCEKNMKCSLFLYGTVGNGKTTLVRAIARMIKGIRSSAEQTMRERGWQLSEQEKRMCDRLSAIPNLCMLTAQKIADYAASEKNDDGKQLTDYSRTKNTFFLAIDDLGCEPYAVKNYGTEVTPVTDILYERYADMKPTIITTNLDLKQIRQQYGDRLADRFNEVFELIGYENKSYRK